MEARRSRLERMQTLPNIKLISSTPSRTTMLTATAETLSEDDDTSCTQQQQQQQQRGRPGKTISFVKRMSEGRFFLTDRTPCRPATSPIPRRPSPLVVTATVTSTSNDADQLQQLHVTKQSTQPARVEVQRQQLKDDDHDYGRSSADVDNNPATTVVQTLADGEDRSDEDGDQPVTAAATLLGPTTDC